MSDIHIYIEREQPVRVITLEPSGKRGPAGPNSVTSATTSDGTCDLSLDTLVVGVGTASGVRSVALGQSTASGALSFAHGISTASEEYSFASGDGSISDGYASSAFNASNASGDFSFACGQNTVASGNNSIAMGFESGASEAFAVAIGRRAKAIHIGASVESDSEAVDVESTATDEKTFRFANGYRFLGGSATFSAGVTVEGTLTADHIHGNLAGSVYAHVRAGETLAKGDPVYISGSHGSGSTLIPIVSKADASNAAKMPAVGIMDAALANNANGHMVIIGTITQLNTNAYAVNSVLYVASGGGFTATPPAANSQPVAIVERANQNNGAVIVKVNGLASSGGNGAADANKLVRFTSTGGISQTGGTMTDTTYAGTAAFTSTTRPTSAGTGTPAATSLITRTDAEYAMIRDPFRLTEFFLVPIAGAYAESASAGYQLNTSRQMGISIFADPSAAQNDWFRYRIGYSRTGNLNGTWRLNRKQELFLNFGIIPIAKEGTRVQFAIANGSPPGTIDSAAISGLAIQQYRESGVVYLRIMRKLSTASAVEYSDAISVIANQICLCWLLVNDDGSVELRISSASEYNTSLPTRPDSASATLPAGTYNNTAAHELMILGLATNATATENSQYVGLNIARHYIFN
jgi:hypothetical protein